MITDKEVQEAVEKTFSEIKNLELLENAYQLYSGFWNEQWFNDLFHKTKWRIVRK